MRTVRKRTPLRPLQGMRLARSGRALATGERTPRPELLGASCASLALAFGCSQSTTLADPVATGMTPSYVSVRQLQQAPTGVVARVMGRGFFASVQVDCDATWGDCNANTADGCETDLATLSDCGSCGTACSLAHATVGGVSPQTETCDANDNDCDGTVDEADACVLRATDLAAGFGHNCAVVSAGVRCWVAIQTGNWVTGARPARAEPNTYCPVLAM